MTNHCLPWATSGCREDRPAPPPPRLFKPPPTYIACSCRDNGTSLITSPHTASWPLTSSRYPSSLMPRDAARNQATARPSICLSLNIPHVSGGSVSLPPSTGLTCRQPWPSVGEGERLERGGCHPLWSVPRQQCAHRDHSTSAVNSSGAHPHDTELSVKFSLGLQQKSATFVRHDPTDPVVRLPFPQVTLAP